MDHDAAQAGTDSARAGTAEDLGFLRAPEPECAGRPDACTCGEHAGQEGGHDHGGHGGGGHAGHGDGGHGDGGGDAHAHMRVFPVRELDADGHVVLLVDELGRTSDAAQSRVRAAAAPAKEHDHEHEHEAAAAPPRRKAPRKRT